MNGIGTPDPFPFGCLRQPAGHIASQMIWPSDNRVEMATNPKKKAQSALPNALPAVVRWCRTRPDVVPCLHAPTYSGSRNRAAPFDVCEGVVADPLAGNAEPIVRTHKPTNIPDPFDSLRPLYNSPPP